MSRKTRMTYKNVSVMWEMVVRERGEVPLRVYDKHRWDYMGSIGNLWINSVTSLNRPMVSVAIT